MSRPVTLLEASIRCMQVQQDYIAALADLSEAKAVIGRVPSSCCRVTSNDIDWLEQQAKSKERLLVAWRKRRYRLSLCSRVQV